MTCTHSRVRAVLCAVDCLCGCGCRNRGVVDGADFAGELPEVVIGTIPVVINPHFTDSVEFHFAPASVHHLLESSLWKRLCDAAASTSGDGAALAARLGLAQKEVEEINAYYHPIHTKPGGIPVKFS